MALAVFSTAVAHLFYTPFTKVEESFNLQAMHDILYLRHNFSQYDHHEYPGVVPRTFLGPLFISILSTPFVLLFEALDIQKFWAQYVVRLVLAIVITGAWNSLRRVISKMFNLEVTVWFTLITITQFHFMFYMSRPLPNILALPLVLYALAYWLSGQIKPFIICSGIAILVFRSELAIFLGLLLLISLLERRTTIDGILKVALPMGLAILATTIAVDSLFWKRLIWPEGEVLWYNTIENKSSNWGTSPLLWYFYSAIPRAMGATVLFVPIGLFYERRVRSIVFAALAFVCIYSLLPHKELRFIIYIFPVLNLAATCGCYRLWINSTKSVWQGFLGVCAGGHLLLNIFITLFLLVISGTNYPGGAALSRLHRLEANTPNVSVHISNLAAQSGVSRFMQIRSDWHYHKNEHLNYTREEIADYTHLLVEAKSKHNTKLWTQLQNDFETLEFVDCFNSIGIQYNSLLPIRIKTKPCIAILKKRTEPKIKLGGNDASAEQSPTGIEGSTLHFSDEAYIEKSTENPEIKDLTEENGIVYDYEDPLSSSVVSVEEQPLSVPVEDDEDGYVADIDDASQERNISIEEIEDTIQTKEINFEELRNLAMGKVTRKTKATKLKIRRIIEQYYRSKGKEIENDSLENEDDEYIDKKTSIVAEQKPSVKSIIKQERIKDIIEQIAKMDLTRVCDLENISTKDCLKQVIDKIDEDGPKT